MKVKELKGLRKIVLLDSEFFLINTILCVCNRIA